MSLAIAIAFILVFVVCLSLFLIAKIIGNKPVKGPNKPRMVTSREKNNRVVKTSYPCETVGLGIRLMESDGDSAKLNIDTGTCSNARKSIYR